MLPQSSFTHFSLAWRYLRRLSSRPLFHGMTCFTGSYGVSATFQVLWDSLSVWISWIGPHEPVHHHFNVFGASVRPCRKCEGLRGFNTIKSFSFYIYSTCSRPFHDFLRLLWIKCPHFSFSCRVLQTSAPFHSNIIRALERGWDNRRSGFAGSHTNYSRSHSPSCCNCLMQTG